MQHPLIGRFQQRGVDVGVGFVAQIFRLVENDLEHTGQRTLDRRPAQFRVSLRGVWITYGEQAPVNADTQIDGCALRNTPVVDVAAEVGRWNRIDHSGFDRGHGNDAEVRPRGNLHVLQHVVIFGDAAAIDRYAGVVNRRVKHATRVALRRPAEIVDSVRTTHALVAVDFVDGDN